LFLVYLPPCYDQQSSLSYPVLYLLHGQTSVDDQWIRMGAAKTADELIHSGQAAPFIMVFPDDRYWNLPPGPYFGDRLIHLIIPYVDSHYRTLPNAAHRALGGLSRGGGWAVHMALTQYNLFGVIGLHSPVIFDDDSAFLDKLMAAVPSSSWPRLWVDAGDRDGDIGDIRRFEALLTSYEVPHEWHLYAGDHTESYWSAHLNEYLLWYTQQFETAGPPAASGTPTP
jgi:enterochelin esterase-like enzyme